MNGPVIRAVLCAQAALGPMPADLRDCPTWCDSAKLAIGSVRLLIQPGDAERAERATQALARAGLQCRWSDAGLEVETPPDAYILQRILELSGLHELVTADLAQRIQEALSGAGPSAARWMLNPRITPGQAESLCFSPELYLLDLFAVGLHVDEDRRRLRQRTRGAVVVSPYHGRFLEGLAPPVLSDIRLDEVGSRGVPVLGLPWLSRVSVSPVPELVERLGGRESQPAAGEILEDVARAFELADAMPLVVGWPVYRSIGSGATLLDAIGGTLLPSE